MSRTDRSAVCERCGDGVEDDDLCPDGYCSRCCVNNPIHDRVILKESLDSDSEF